MPSNHKVMDDSPRVGRTSSITPTTASLSCFKPDILDQIFVAFQKRPDVANVLHGQRRIIQGGKGRRTALFSSNKSGGAVPVESKLELAHAVALERSSRVLRFRTQAVCIALTERNIAYPDFLVEVEEGQFEIHEIKPSIPHLSVKDTQRFERIERVLRPFGIEFRVIDAASLVSGRELEEILLNYTRGHAERYTPAQVALALEVLKNKPLAWLSDAYRMLAVHDLPPCLADYLDFHGQWTSPPRERTFGIGRA